MVPGADAHKKYSKEMCDANFNTSKFSDNFKVIVLKTLRVLNVNCAKILAKKFDFIACVQSIKKSFQMMYGNLCLSFHETVPLMHYIVNQYIDCNKRVDLSGFSNGYR